MRTAWTRLIAIIMIMAVVGAACGGDRDSESVDGRGDDAAADDGSEPEPEPEPAGDDPEPAPDDDGTDPEPTDDSAEPPPDPEPEVVLFGDAPAPCGPGDAGGATDTGVTDTSIQIGTADDRGFVGGPGLNREMGDTMVAMVEWCNELGGINGREIVINLYDGAIFSAQAAQLESCDAGDFMMVGDGLAFDNLSLPERIACDMAHVPAWTVSADAAHAPRMIQPVPNPVDAIVMSQSVQLARIYPDLIDNVGVMLGNFDATRVSAAKIRAGSEQFGYTFPDDVYLEYNVQGEEDWSPFINTLQDAGSGLVFFSGSCPNFFLNFMQQAAVQNYSPITFADGNFLSEECAASNTDGVMDGLHVRSATVPFTEREFSAGIDDYLTIVDERANGEVTGISLQSASAFLLWATAVKACGSEVTDECVLAAIADLDEWTGHGMHAPTDPASNMPTACGALFRLEGTEFIRVAPEEPGTFECDDSFIVAIDTPFSEAANLDADRVTQNVG